MICACMRARATYLWFELRTGRPCASGMRPVGRRSAAALQPSHERLALRLRIVHAREDVGVGELRLRTQRVVRKGCVAGGVKGGELWSIFPRGCRRWRGACVRAARCGEGQCEERHEGRCGAACMPERVQKGACLRTQRALATAAGGNARVEPSTPW
eukprot:346090-Chlamydomonas_euryale.AAC.1